MRGSANSKTLGAVSAKRWRRPRHPYLTQTEDGLLRQVVYQGLREDKPAKEVRLERP
jgi:hypothetical protein